MYTYHNFFIHSSVDEYLGHFHVLAIVNSAAVNHEVHVSFPAMVSSGYVHSHSIVVSYASFIPSFLRNLHTVLGEGNGNPLQYSCLENPMDRGAWRATVHGVAKSQIQLSD